MKKATNALLVAWFVVVVTVLAAVIAMVLVMAAGRPRNATGSGRAVEPG